MFFAPSNLLLRSFLLILLLVGSAQAAESQAYYSDYFSFVGQDESGYLLFALGNERSVDGDEYQAKHSGVLYDQYQGWVNLVGIGEYKNNGANLEKIPNSPIFQFAGQPSSGLTIRSRANDLLLDINPVAVRMHEERSNSKLNWGTASAMLSWQGRSIPGRVIYEGMSQQKGKHQTRNDSDSWDNFQGFYLAVKSGPAANWQDIYLRSEGMKKRQRTRGFIDAGRRQASIMSSDLKTTDKGWALGFYRWSKAWELNLQQVQPDGRTFPPFARLELQQVSRQNISNWVIGGVAMSVVEGTIKVNGQMINVLGFAELIN